MAERRMFAKTIVDSDAFLDMPASARLLYYDLGMRADDDGFVNSPKKIMRTTGASPDDLNVLCAKKFIIPFEDGVVVIKHWRIHNYIRKDTYNETKYKEDKQQLELDENNAYRRRDVDDSETQDRLGKDRIGKNNIYIQNSTPTLSISDEFEAIWTLYPRHEGKQNALKAYQKARKDGVSKEDVENGIRRYVEYIRNNKISSQYVKMGSTWFNQRCWNDEYKDFAPNSDHPINPNASRNDTFGEIPF